MNKEYAFLAKENERWQRRNLSRIVAIMVTVLSLLAFTLQAISTN